MSKPPKTDFKTLIASQVAPAMMSEPEAPPAPEPAAPALRAIGETPGRRRAKARAPFRVRGAEPLRNRGRQAATKESVRDRSRPAETLLRLRSQEPGAEGGCPDQPRIIHEPGVIAESSLMGRPAPARATAPTWGVCFLVRRGRVLNLAGRLARPACGRGAAGQGLRSAFPADPAPVPLRRARPRQSPSPVLSATACFARCRPDRAI
jgi:hypothetical protein